MCLGSGVETLRCAQDDSAGVFDRSWSKPGVDAAEVSPDVVLDLNADGNAVGIEVEHASEKVELSRLEAEALPTSSLSLVGS